MSPHNYLKTQHIQAGIPSATVGNFPRNMFQSGGMLRRIILGTGLGSLFSQSLPQPARVLWTGSSSMYYHDMPLQVAGWLNRFGPKRRLYESAIAGRSGSGIHVYLKPGSFKPEYGFLEGQTFIEKIAAERNDFVVLQAVAEFISGPEGQEHASALGTYCDAIRKAGGEPAIYEMGWRANDGPGREQIRQAARNWNVRTYAPCSTAWARVRAERPDLDLQIPPDRSHPGPLGHYLNLCCLFTAFAGTNPNVLPLDFPVWLPLDDAAKQLAERKVSERGTTGIPYYDSLPRFLKRRSSMAQPFRLAPATGAYLQKVAWDCWRESSQMGQH